MKKKFLFLTMSFMLFCSTFFFFACEAKLEPHIEVHGIQTEFFIGDTLPLGTTYILYYEDKDSKEWNVKYNVTRDMVSGFSTEKMGTFTMTVKYNDLTTTVQYTVVDPYYRYLSDFEIFETVLDDSLKSNKIKTISKQNEETVVTKISSEEVYYEENSNNKVWLKKEDQVWFEFTETSTIIEQEEIKTYEKRELSIDYTNVKTKIFEDLEFFEDNLEKVTVIENGFKFYLKKGNTNYTITSKNRKISLIELKQNDLNEKTYVMHDADVVDVIPGLPEVDEWPEISLEPRIVVEGLKTEYNLGDVLDISNAIVKYYEYEDDMLPSAYLLTEDLIEGFTTETAGTFTMTITFNECTYKIDYVVIDPNEEFDLEEILNTALNNLLSSEKIMIEMENSLFNIKTIVTDDKIYDLTSFSAIWTIKEDDVWYDYEVITFIDNGEEKTIYQKSISYVTGDSAIEFMFGGGDESQDDFNDIKIKRIVGGFLIEYYTIDSTSGERIDYVLTIIDDKIYSSVATQEGEVMEEMYYYNNDAEVIPGLPEPPDGKWTVVQ